MILELALLYSLLMGGHTEITTTETIIVEEQVMRCQICGRDAKCIVAHNGQISMWCHDHRTNNSPHPDIRNLIAYLKYDADLWRASGHKSRDTDQTR
jgi:hypothetical protein